MFVFAFPQRFRHFATGYGAQGECAVAASLFRRAMEGKKKRLRELPSHSRQHGILRHRAVDRSGTQPLQGFLTYRKVVSRLTVILQGA